MAMGQKAQSLCSALCFWSTEYCLLIQPAHMLPHASNSALASRKSFVSNPSVNHLMNLDDQIR
jgi:hypothetical protein